MSWFERNLSIVLLALSIVIILLGIFVCNTAGAKELEFKLISPGEQGLIGKDRAQCYRLDVYLELYAFDQELVKLRADVADYKAIVEKQEQALKKKDEQIDILKRDKDILAKRDLRCDADLKECEKDLVDAAGGPWWAYALGIAGGVSLIVGSSMILASRWSD